jgi:hypothetical protein
MRGMQETPPTRVGMPSREPGYPKMESKCHYCKLLRNLERPTIRI